MRTARVLLIIAMTMAGVLPVRNMVCAAPSTAATVLTSKSACCCTDQGNHNGCRAICLSDAQQHTAHAVVPSAAAAQIRYAALDLVTAPYAVMGPVLRAIPVTPTGFASPPHTASALYLRYGILRL